MLEFMNKPATKIERIIGIIVILIVTLGGLYIILR